MILRNVRVALNSETTETLTLIVDGERLSLVGAQESRSSQPALDLTGFLVLPGLINAHDHLEFNLFPKLGGSDYQNAKSWASEIHHPAASPLKEHLALSKSARMLWGGLKNLLSGVTTVAHHNPVDHPALDLSFPVNVVRRFGWAHSLDFSPDLGERFRRTPENWPFILHAAEGVDDHARAEIGKLERLGVLGERTVLVHAIGMDQPDLHLLRRRRCALVWCPSSNVSTYGRTLGAAVLQSDLTVVLGTDSALTAPVDLIDEIGVAKSAHQVSLQDLFEMVTLRSASVMRLVDGEGAIREGGVADLVIVKDFGQTPAEALHNLRPEIVMVRGKIRLIASDARRRAGAFCGGQWHSIDLEGRGKWFTDVNLPALRDETASALGTEYRLAGRRVLI